ncbi:hypothetical protein ABPG77_003371 [Micractinium sp. CCAP 211/92]
MCVFYSALRTAVRAAGIAVSLPEDLEGSPEPRYYPPLETYFPGAPDFSHAGYKDSDEPLPVLDVHYNVVEDFGAKGDGVTDDTAALQAAVAAANSQPGVMYLPAGSYLLSKPLAVLSSGVVIRGAGENATRIVISQPLSAVYPNTRFEGDQGVVATEWAAWGGFLSIKGTPQYHGTAETWLAAVAGPVEPGSQSIPVDDGNFTAGQWVRVFAGTPDGRELQLSARVANLSSDWIELDRPLPFSIEAWRGSVHDYAPPVQDSGIERLTVEFSSPGTYGAHGSDQGFNSIFLLAASNVWVKQVTILNADNAVLLHRVDHATLADITVDATSSRANPADATWQRQGHHGIALADCHAVLVERFRIGTRYYHDLAVTDGSLLNVFTAGSGFDLNVHTQAGDLANLFSDLDSGLGNRLFDSPGATSPGAGTTFFNVRSEGSEAATTRSAFSSPSEPTGSSSPLPASCDYGSDLHFFGAFNHTSSPCPGWAVTPLNSSLPADLWTEQLFLRGDEAPVPEGARRPGAGSARTACRTFMGDSEDPVSCWVLVYDHCIPGYTNRNDIPRPILEHEQQVIAAVFQTAAPSGSFGEPPHLMRDEYSRVCVANATLAGSGECSRKIRSALLAAPDEHMAFVHECWDQGLDLNSGQPYWFNRATGVSQWHPPPGRSAPSGSALQQPEHECESRSPSPPAVAAAAAGEAGAAQPPADSGQQGQQQEHHHCRQQGQPWDPQWQQQWEPGLYYRDAAGLLQGPFTLEQLQGWRGMLPMDLPVLRLAAGSSMSCEAAAAAAGDPDNVQQPGRGQGGRDDQGPAAAAQAQQVSEQSGMQLPRSAASGQASKQQQAGETEQQRVGNQQHPDAGINVQQATGNKPPGGARRQERGGGQPPEEAQPQGSVGEQQPETAAAQERGGYDGERQLGMAEQQRDGSGWEELLLADLLGDGELLERWRLEYPEQAAWPGTAPPAPAYAAERARGSAYSLAEAVLSGLPAHDEAVALARAAAAAGKSLQEVAAWGREVDYTATAYRVAARGRIQADGAKESLYAEAASWANPAELEQQLARAAERRKRGLRGGELRAVKQRKAELKEKKRREWLFA